MNAKHAFKPVVADTTLETRVVLSTIAPRAAVGVINTPVYFNPTQNTTNPTNPRAPIAFGMFSPRATAPVVTTGNTPSYFNPTHNTTNPGNPRAPIAFGFLPRPPVTPGSGFAGSGANSGRGFGRGNSLYL